MNPSSVRPATGVPADPDLHVDSVTIPVKLCNLPPFHPIATQVLALSADPELDLKSLAVVIEKDPAFAADILFLANSSLFGFPSRMQVLRHAIAVLGLDRINALAVTVAMRAFVGNRSPLVRQCWWHSAACAIICEEISPLFDFSGDRAYTAGLMHDIGRLGLLKSYPREVTAVLQREYSTTEDVLRAERATLNVDHTRAGAWLAQHWAFPESLEQVCEHHHDPLEQSDVELVQLVKLACGLANAIGFSAVNCRMYPSYNRIVSAVAPGLGPKAFPPENELRANVEARLRAADQ